MKRIPYVHLVLFLLTFLSTLVVGAMHEGIDIVRQPSQLYRGFPFSVSILFILLAHEFSHFIASKRHDVEASLPYFIPFPNLFGTFGAFIRMKSPITTRNALVDIGASGPIAGFVISVAAVCIGLFLSNIRPVPANEGFIALGDSLLFKALTQFIVGNVPENHDIYLHPIAFAGWIGFFVTSMNLIPIGQLDGGHILYALIGEKHVAFSKILLGVLAVLGIFVWEGWLIWAVLLLLLGFRHPPIMHSWVPLDAGRRKIGWLSLGIFILTFTPIPIIIS